MPNYAIHNDQGEILRTVECPEEFIHLQVNEGEFYHECDARYTDRIDIATMQVIRQDELVPPEPVIEPYMEQRRFMYPSITNQLDMLWHAMDRGEIPKADRFFNAIKVVKDAIPKDNSAAPLIIYNVGEIPDEDLE